MIPPGLGNLTNLDTLDLSGNRLRGSIPATLGNLSELEALRLDNNLLNGDIPAELGDLANLEALWLSNNGPERGNSTGTGGADQPAGDVALEQPS